MPGRAAIQKTIFDPVHGPVALSGAALELIGTAEFQRLWGIRQTGFAHLVFPGANHTRLEHSLGVFWVAGAMASALDLSASESEILTLAGLLHDLGHGPFSHTLEPAMREVSGEGHEHRGRMLIEGRGRPAIGTMDFPHVTEVLQRHGISSRKIADLIDPPRSSKAGLLRDLLHGAIDADRIDYLQRDAHYTGVAHGAIDAARLIGTIQPYRGRLAFAGKGRSALEGFLVGRSLMYSSVYYHKTVRAAEVMAQSAVERLPEYPRGVRELFDLTDGDFLCELRHRDGRARALVEGLLNRRLYKRAFGLREVPSGTLAAWRKIGLSGWRRRALEDDLADRLEVPRGSALLDLAGLEPRAGGPSDWAAVTVVERDGATHPFRPPSLWHDLAHRPPTVDPVSLYLPGAFRRRAGPRVARVLRSLV